MCPSCSFDRDSVGFCKKLMVFKAGQTRGRNELRERAFTKRFDVPNVKVWGRKQELEADVPLKREAEPFTCKAWEKASQLCTSGINQQRE